MQLLEGGVARGTRHNKVLSVALAQPRTSAESWLGKSSMRLGSVMASWSPSNHGQNTCPFSPIAFGKKINMYQDCYDVRSDKDMVTISSVQPAFGAFIRDCDDPGRE